jgi:hypothetical protein
MPNRTDRNLDMSQPEYVLHRALHVKTEDSFEIRPLGEFLIYITVFVMLILSFLLFISDIIPSLFAFLLFALLVAITVYGQYLLLTYFNIQVNRYGVSAILWAVAFLIVIVLIL